MRSITIIIFAIAVLYGCATPSTPQGGPQDKNAPIVKNYSPDVLTTNFKEKDIVISFDEWVQVQNLKQNLIISPPIQPEPNIYAKKNELHVHFKEGLQENTTYSIFFGDAVKDNNEGNLISNLTYVFSTGDKLDSLKVAGNVHTLDGTQIPENTFVQLYKLADDSIITRERPSYIYKISKEGSFEINYLPTDTFQLFVLNDLNSNYLYDLPTEWIGKLDQHIYLDSIVNGLEIPIVLPETDNFKIVQFNNTLEDNFLTIELNKELNPSKSNIFLEKFSSGKIVPFFNNYTSKKLQYYIAIDSLSMNCELSIDSNIVDTLRVRKPSKPSENLIFRPKGQIVQKDSILSAFDNANFELVSNTPIQKVDSSKIFVVSEQDTSHIYSYDILENGFVLKVTQPLKEGFKGHLFFQDSSILFLNGKFLDSTSFQMSYAPSSLYGQMSFDIRFPSLDTTYIVRVYHKNGYLLDELLSRGDSSLLYALPPFSSGEFFIEVIEDLNESATWNGASFWNFRAPERVFVSQNFAVKPNWEDTQTIDVRFDKAQPPFKAVSLLDLMKSSSTSKSSVTNSSSSPMRNSSSNVNSTFSSPRQQGLPDLKMK